LFFFEKVPFFFKNRRKRKKKKGEYPKKLAMPLMIPGCLKKYFLIIFLVDFN